MCVCACVCKSTCAFECISQCVFVCFIFLFMSECEKVCMCVGDEGGVGPGLGQELILWRRTGNEEKKKNGIRSRGVRRAGRKKEGEWKGE